VEEGGESFLDDNPAAVLDWRRQAVGGVKMGAFDKEILFARGASPDLPYAPAVASGPFVISSGQIGKNLETGELAPDFATQARQALENLRELMARSHVLQDNILKVTVYLVNEEDYAKLNELFVEFFPRKKPARTTVVVKALPFGALIEVEAMGTRIYEPPSTGSYVT